MKVTGLALCPPPAASQNPKVTPELLASSLAKYSRSNKGIDSILSGIDWNDPDKSVEAIFKFVDYGHASIAGLTGGIAMAIDGCSMFLAYKLFELAQLSDGQESSTRYIELSPQGLPSADELGIPTKLQAEWSAVMAESFAMYKELYTSLDAQAQANPDVVRFPKGASDKVIARLRKNYALDRARYFIPFATRNNCALVMTARVWAQTIRQLDAMPLLEARRCAELLRAELGKFAPRLIRHSFRDEASVAQAEHELSFARNYIAAQGVGIDNIPDEVFVTTEGELPPFLGATQDLPTAFKGKTNRYSVVGESVRRVFVRFAWNNIALAELRDLNRHRSGARFTPLTPVGFYLPPEVSRDKVDGVLRRQKQLIEKLAAESVEGAHLYGYLLGVQTPFEHSTHLDKFIYEVELRTGLGAHYRYADHLAKACEVFLKQRPEYGSFIEIGTAEPE
jgi:thymidylate synthase ThyX